MKRKFSFDIPRLKIGSLRADLVNLKANKDTFAVDLESPPLTPYRSVRPSLPSDVDIELRTACTYILKGLKQPSSNAVEQPSNASGQRPQLDYATIRGVASKPAEKLAEPLSASLTQVTSHVEPALVEEEESVQLSPDRFRYKPETATKDLFRREEDDQVQVMRTAVSRADELMAGPVKQEGQKVGRDRSMSHSRAQSAPFVQPAAAAETTLAERPTTIPRMDSVETTGSTPQTDSTDYPWSASTAMTSAAMTPARSSKRASCQAQSGSEASSLPSVVPVYPDWMRQELEKHKRAQEEKAAAAANNSDLEDKSTNASTQVPTPVAKVPARKPVPHSRSASNQATEGSRPATRHSDRSHDGTRPESRQTQSTVRPESRQAAEPVRTQNKPMHRHNTRVGRERGRPDVEQLAARAASRARSVSRDVKEYFRPSSRQGYRTGEGREESQPSASRRSESRTRVVTRHVKEYLKPGSTTNSRKPSLDIPRTMSRSRSTDSFHSAGSDMSPTSETSNDKWAKWKPFHRRQGSKSSVDFSRPGSSSSNRNGLTGTPKAKTINLNRELPPLPGLDAWKDEEPESSKEVPAVSTTAPSVKSVPQAALGETDEIVAARMGSPVSNTTKSPGLPKRTTSLRQIARSIPLMPKAPPPEPPPATSGATTPGTADLLHVPSPGIVPADVKQMRRRSKSIQPAGLAPSMDEMLRSGASSPAPSKPSASTSKAHLVNQSRVPSGGFAGTLSRAVSRRVAPPARSATTSANTPRGHSRTNSNHSYAPSFPAKSPSSGKFSMDESAGRMFDNRRNHLVELSNTRSHSSTNTKRTDSGTAETVPPLPTQSKDNKAKKKWWRPAAVSTGKERTKDWMDQVLKSGAHSGVLLTDETAGGPIVRF